MLIRGVGKERFPMNQDLVASESGHCPHEDGKGSWKSYEVGCRHPVRSLVVLV